ncbi:monooxygenase FAD-binding [Burkholderia sp. H160]|nr:monooxygenase FAD-binding [Burkholderia sp. H160]
MTVTNQKYDADVAIIGYGPSGVVAANVLGKRGIKTIAIERFKDIYARARAVTVNDWTMRIVQDMGLAEQQLAVMDDVHSLRWVDYEGRQLTWMPFPPSSFGFASSYCLYQPAMERVLREGTERYQNVEVRYEREMSTIRQDQDGVTIETKNLVTGETETIRAKYALACDGGSSSSREQLGVKLIGDTLSVRWVVIDCRVKRWWPNRHMHTFWADARRPVVDIPLGLGNHRWEFPLNQDESDEDFQSHDQLWKLLNSLGVTENEVEIHQHAFYNHHVRYADRWRVGRVLLCGDAAHLMPPWAGNGMQSGIRDAQNASLKLVEVLEGRLPETLLDTYEQERAPDVERYTQISVGLGMIIKRELSDEQVAAMMEEERASGDLPMVLRPPHYQQGWLQKGAGSKDVVGKFLPQPLAANCKGQVDRLDDLTGNGLIVLGANTDPASKLDAEQKAAWEKLGATFIAVRSADQRAQADNDVVDINGELIAWMQKEDVDVVVVRQDKIIAAASGNLDVPAL